MALTRDWPLAVEHVDAATQIGGPARLADGLVAEAETVVPGLAAAIMVMDVATPLTFAERGGRSEGAVAGWSWDYGEANDFEP